MTEITNTSKYRLTVNLRELILETTKTTLLNNFYVYRWVVWSLLVMAYMVSFFHRMSVSVVRDTLTTSFGMSATEFGTMASMYFYAYCIAQIPAGVLADMLGVRITAAISMLIAAISTIAFGFASSVEMLFISRFFVGIGVAACFVCVLKAQSQWFRPREFSTLSGICLFGGNLGSLLAQGPLVLFVALLSFQYAFLAIGSFTLLIGLLCFTFVRNKPQDMGFKPIVESSGATEKVSLFNILKSVLIDRKIIPLFCFYFLVTPQFFAFAGTWSTTYIIDNYGFSLEKASSLASLQTVGFMLGSFFIGYLSDRKGLRKPFLVIPTFLSVAIWCCLAFLGGSEFDYRLLVGSLFVVGFLTGSLSVMMAMCKESVAVEHTGTAIATLNTFGFLGIAVATPIYGYFLDVFVNDGVLVGHENAIFFLATLTFVGFLATLFTKETCVNSVT